MEALAGFASWSRLTGPGNDDWVDRLSHIYTVLILSVFSIIITTTQYVGDPIECWCPAEFTDSFINYAKHVCWISNTYYISLDRVIPRDEVERRVKEVTYYQWVPIMLAAMALLFKLPNLTWNILNGTSGLNIDNVTRMAKKAQTLPLKERGDVIRDMTFVMERWIETHRDYRYNLFVRIRDKCRTFFWWLGGNRSGTYLTGLYLSCKVLYLANSVGQFFLLDAFLASPDTAYGFHLAVNLTRYGSWEASPRFPRVTLCDFQIRQMQNIQQFTVQCVLPINIFNEKLFIFIWFWLVLVSTLTCVSLLVSSARILLKTFYVEFVKKYLLVADEIHTGFRRNMLNRFASRFLRPDGIFVLRLVGQHSSDMVVRDLVVELWKVSKETPEFRKPELNEDIDSSTEFLA